MRAGGEIPLSGSSGDRILRRPPIEAEDRRPSRENRPTRSVSRAAAGCNPGPPEARVQHPSARLVAGATAPLARELLVDEPRGIREFFEVTTVRRLVEAHMSGRRNHAHRLWALMLFAQWYRSMLEDQAYKVDPPPFPDL